MSTGTSISPTMPRPLLQNNGNAYGAAEATGYPAFQAVEATAPNNLEDGAMVVMYAGPGELIIVRPNGKYWDVEPISTTEESEELTLQFFPSVSIFSVVRKGKVIAFKSLAAEGRTLQAVAADSSVPLRVNNYNFGTWESWEVAGSELINKKWPQRTLGLEVREIQAVAVEDLRRLERHNLNMSKNMQKQVRTLELKLQETKRQLQEQTRSRKRMSVQHQRELEDSRSRLEEALRAKQRLEVDAVQTGARLKQKELQFQQLSLQRDSAEAALEQKEANQRAHEREIANLKEKHQNEIDSLGRLHRNEIEALRRDREHERGRSTQHANGEVALLQQKLEQVEQEKDREIRRICMDHQAALQQKVNEISNLKEENQRLAMALQTIKDQLTRGFVAINSSEVAPSRAGTERSLEIPVSGYRYSPAPSRASTGRRADDANEGAHYPFGESGMTPRRCSLPCPPHSPYGRSSPAHSPEPFPLRHEFSRPRRGDSRLSDSTALGRTSDEIPFLSRRPASGFARTHRHADALNSRYSSQLDSVEDRMHKEEGSEFNDDASEHEGRERRQNDETESEIDARTNDTPRQIIEENEDAEEDEEQEQHEEAEAEKAVDSDGISDSSEEELPMEQTEAAGPEDALFNNVAVDMASDAPPSWDAKVTPLGQQPEAGSDTESSKDSKLADE